MNQDQLREALDEFDGELTCWSQAYPYTVFPEVNLEKAHEALQAAGMTLDAVSASNMRYVLARLNELFQPVRAALLEASAQQGEIVITKNEAGQIVAVTRQDEEGRILDVIAEAFTQREQPAASKAKYTRPMHAHWDSSGDVFGCADEAERGVKACSKWCGKAGCPTGAPDYRYITSTNQPGEPS